MEKDTNRAGAATIDLPTQQEIREKNARARRDTILAGIEERFSYHAPTPETLPRFEMVRAKMKETARVLAEVCPSMGGELDYALLHLEQVGFIANAAIARHPGDLPPLEPGVPAPPVPLQLGSLAPLQLAEVIFDACDSEGIEERCSGEDWESLQQETRDMYFRIANTAIEAADSARRMEAVKRLELPGAMDVAIEHASIISSICGILHCTPENAYEQVKRLVQEKEEFLDVERGYTQRLGEMARLCDIVCEWLTGPPKPGVESPHDVLGEVMDAAYELKDYVDAVRPAEGEEMTRPGPSPFQAIIGFLDLWDDVGNESFDVPKGVLVAIDGLRAVLPHNRRVIASGTEELP